MNQVILCGRLTKDPNVSYSSSGICVARFNLALDRGKDKDGQSKGADFPSCVAFGKVAELIERYLTKGSQTIITGHIQTGSYEKNGQKVYTTDVVVDRTEFVGARNDTLASENTGRIPASDSDIPSQNIPEGFTMSEDDIPFGG